MDKRTAIFAVCVLAMLWCVAGCSGRGRLLPRSRMVDIYADIFMADQYIMTYPEERRRADTSLFYESIFNRNGCTFADYDRSVNYYLDHPEKFIKIMKMTSARLSARHASLVSEQAAQDRIIAFNKAIKGYVRKDFSSDSLRWAYESILWGCTLPDSAYLDSIRRDSLRLDSLRLDSLRLDSIRRDSIRVDSLLKAKNVKGRNGIRTDKKPALGKLPRN